MEGLRSSGDIGQTVALLAVLGTVPTALAYVLFFHGLHIVRATTASAVALIEPVTAAVVAVVALGERLTPLGRTGGALPPAWIRSTATTVHDHCRNDD